MNGAQRHLRLTSQRPWRYDERRSYIVDANGDYVHWDHEGLGAMWNERDDPALIVYAVNRLPDYDAAVEALERLLATSVVTDEDGQCQVCLLPMDHEAPGCEAHDAAAAVRRLRVRVLV